MQKLVNKIKEGIEKIVPLYTVVPFALCFIWNGAVYFVIRLFLGNVHHYDFTTDFDRAVPFVPAWVSIYVLCYIYWIFNYILIGRQDKEHFYQFITAELIAKTICGLFFLFLPTTNIRPEITGTGIWDQLMQFIYNVDAPTNLFPSIHCLESWFCYLYIRGRHNVPRWYQWFSCMFAVLVMASTQFTKQHYIVDVFGGVLLAQGCYLLCKKKKIYGHVMNFFERINHGRQEEKPV